MGIDGPGFELTIVSGGQTGVDRAVLDAALAADVPCGGWCPSGRRAEDGPIPLRYPLRETDSADYAERTRRNVRDADATLVLYQGKLSGGTLYTVGWAMRLGKPLWVVENVQAPGDYPQIARWLRTCRAKVLNVAGPREGERPGIYATARVWTDGLLGFLTKHGP